MEKIKKIKGRKGFVKITLGWKERNSWELFTYNSRR